MKEHQRIYFEFVRETPPPPPSQLRRLSARTGGDLVGSGLPVGRRTGALLVLRVEVANERSRTAVQANDQAGSGTMLPEAIR